MDLKQLSIAVEQISEERGIPKEKVFGAIENALAAAYKKEYRKKTEIIRAKYDPQSGLVSFYQVKIVVDPKNVIFDPGEKETKSQEEKENLIRFNPDRHILLEDAKKLKSDVEVGEELIFPLEDKKDFGRIAAQTAKQVILQSIREAERESIREEFSDKEDKIISGQIQRFERGNVYVNLGRAIGIMYPNESIPGEHYRVGDRMRFYVLAVQDDTKRPGIVLSRAHPNFIARLFELEVPEIAEGSVVIRSIAREPGSRTKIALESKEEGIDAVGSAVGQRGTRIMSVTNELNGEKIDVIEWSDDPVKFISNALSPAKVKSVEILPRREAKVLVSEDQLSLAIGKGGQNVRLAAKLTGWKIDVRSQSNPDVIQEGGIAEAIEEGPIFRKVDEEEEDNPRLDEDVIKDIISKDSFKDEEKVEDIEDSSENKDEDNSDEYFYEDEESEESEEVKKSESEEKVKSEEN